MDEDVVYIYIHTHNGILVIRKKEILPFATIQMDLESIMLCEIGERQLLYVIIYIWNLMSSPENPRFLYKASICSSVSSTTSDMWVALL